MHEGVVDERDLARPALRPRAHGLALEHLDRFTDPDHDDVAGVDRVPPVDDRDGLGPRRPLQSDGAQDVEVDPLCPGDLDLAMQRVPAGRKGDPRELAATAVWLASDAAGYVTGQMIPVDGGLTVA